LVSNKVTLVPIVNGHRCPRVEKMVDFNYLIRVGIYVFHLDILLIIIQSAAVNGIRQTKDTITHSALPTEQ